MPSADSREKADNETQSKERIKFDKGRLTESRQSSRDYHSSQFNESMLGNRRRVNFKHKGTINFSYSFMPEDVLSKKSIKLIKARLKIMNHLVGEFNENSQGLKDEFIKEILANSVNVPEIKEK